MGTTTTQNPMLARLFAQRDEQVAFVEQMTDKANEAGRDLVEAEVANLRAAQERVAQLDAQIAPLVEFEQSRARATPPAAPNMAKRPHAPWPSSTGTRPTGKAGSTSTARPRRKPPTAPPCSSSASNSSRRKSSSAWPPHRPCASCCRRPPRAKPCPKEGDKTPQNTANRLAPSLHRALI